VTAFLLAAVAVLVLLNGFFVGAEFALVRARRSRIEAMEKDGARGARLARSQIDRIDEYLAACQLGITMASLGIGFLGEPAIARLLERPLGSVVSHGVAVATAIAIAYLIVTAAHITVGEQVPKIYAITHADSAVRWAAAPLQWFNILARPLIFSLNSISNAMLRLVGTQPSDFHERASDEELRLLIAEGAVGGALMRREAEMLSGVFHLHDQEARQVMTPFHSVVRVDRSVGVGVALNRCIESGHTRLVVVEPDRPDQVVGIVHTNSLARLLLSVGQDASIEPTVKPLQVVPEVKRLDELLADLQRDRQTMALVADEYGVPAGIVTVEDIIEEIVGEIADETDAVTRPVRRLPDGDWYVRGDLSLEDLKDYGIDLPADSDAFTSVGGLVFTEIGHLPATGDVVTVNGYSLRVESVRGNRIEAVRIRDGQRAGRAAENAQPQA
jgi:CBS domain containing-hemolysin-like protein